MNKVVIEDYYYMTVMNKYVNEMKLTHLLSDIPVNLRAPFCTFSFTSHFFSSMSKCTH